MMDRKLAWFGLYAVALVLVAARPGMPAWAAEETPLAPETKEIGKVPYVPTPPEVVDAMLKMAEHPGGACPLDTEGLLSVLKRVAKAHES